MSSVSSFEAINTVIWCAKSRERFKPRYFLWICAPVSYDAVVNSNGIKKHYS